jgi:hypothetical protein
MATMRIPKSVPRDLKPAAELAVSTGWRVQRTRSGHLKWVTPDGRPVFCGSTPSKWKRGHENTIAKLRRAGLAILRETVYTALRVWYSRH